MPSDALCKLRRAHGQRVRAKLGPAGNGRERAWRHPVDPTHLDGVEEAQLLATLEGQPKDRGRCNLLRRRRPLQPSAEHRVDDQVLTADVEDQEFPAPPGSFERSTAELACELVGWRAQQKAQLWRRPDLRDLLPLEARAKVFAEHFEFGKLWHRPTRLAEVR